MAETHVETAYQKARRVHDGLQCDSETRRALLVLMLKREEKRAKERNAQLANEIDTVRRSMAQNPTEAAQQKAREVYGPLCVQYDSETLRKLLALMLAREYDICKKADAEFANDISRVMVSL